MLVVHRGAPLTTAVVHGGTLMMVVVDNDGAPSTLAVVHGIGGVPLNDVN